MSKILILTMLLTKTLSDVTLTEDRPHQFYSTPHWYLPRFDAESSEDSLEENSILTQQPNKFMGEVSVLADRYPFFKRSQISDYAKDFSHTTTCSKICKTDSTLRDLGRDYFPRFVAEVECKKNTKYPSYLECRQTSYSLTVMKRREENDVEHKLASLLPPELKEKWISRLLTITVACECGIF